MSPLVNTYLLTIFLMPNFLEAIPLNSEIGQKQPNLELIRDRRETGESQGGEGRIIRIMVAPLPLHQVTKRALKIPTLFWFSIQVAQKRGWLRMLKAFLPHERHSKYSDYPEIDEVGKAYKRSAIIIDELFLVMRFSTSNPCYVLSEKILTFNESA